MKRRSSVAAGFLALIAVGALLLASPWARTDGAWGGALSSLFTACSAVCVTGLTVVPIAEEFSFAGQCVLLALVELGCLGLMTCGTFLMIAIGRRLSLASEFSLMNAYGVEQVQGLKGLIVWIVGSMLAIEGVAAAVLSWRLGSVYRGVFFSVMGFCNAGFSLLPGSVAAFADDPVVLLTLAVETILGGIGFLVIFNLFTYKFLRRGAGGRRRLSLHARVTLRMTAILLAFAFAAFLLLEWNGTLAAFSPAKKCLVGFYHAVTPRTCGFSVVPIESLEPITRLVYEILMFIGGAPGSAAAGMKVTTFAVLLYTVTALCRNEQDTVIDGRVVPYDTVRESIVIFTAMAATLVLTTGALFVTESRGTLSSDALFFEAVSAVTTTGLSMGETTARLSAAGKIVVMAAMFFGRLGALTVVMMIGDRESKKFIRFPTEELVVG
jgi:trk system potassium uptake protein TrkH